jgi:hypothetical protein
MNIENILYICDGKKNFEIFENDKYFKQYIKKFLI